MAPVVGQTADFRLISVAGTVTFYSMNLKGNHFAPRAICGGL